MPKVLNKRTDNIPSDAIYVGRPSYWGNPFVIGKDGTRGEVITKYSMTLHYKQREAIKRTLKGKDLICWCAPEACHADVLLEIANGNT